MPYLVLRDGATVPKALSESKQGLPDGTVVTVYDTESNIYLAGDVIADADVSPTVVQRLEAGDAHVSSLLQHVEEGDETYRALSQMSPDQKREFARAADIAALGPNPKDVGATGLTAAPGVIDPAAAAERSQAQAEAGETVNVNAPVDEGDGAKEAPKRGGGRGRGSGSEES